MKGNILVLVLFLVHVNIQNQKIIRVHLMKANINE